MNTEQKLREVLQKALEALISCSPEDTTTGNVIYASFDESLVDAAIKQAEQALAEPAQGEPDHSGLIKRIDAAIDRVTQGRGLMSIPADPRSDVDLVLAECKCLLEGRYPPFWASDFYSGFISGEKDWQVLKTAVDTWGEYEQVMMAIGECGEFLTLMGRKVQGRLIESDMHDEIADVLIMMHQMANIYGIDHVRARVRHKMEKLALKLEKSRAALAKDGGAK